MERRPVKYSMEYAKCEAIDQVVRLEEMYRELIHSAVDQYRKAKLIADSWGMKMEDIGEYIIKVLEEKESK